MALASFRTLNSPAPKVSISLAASAAIPDFVRPTRVPGFRFGFDIDVFFFGILMMATKTLGRARKAAPHTGIMRLAHYQNSATIYLDKPTYGGGAALRKPRWGRRHLTWPSGDFGLQEPVQLQAEPS
jgi:hypothetical protein